METAQKLLMKVFRNFSVQYTISSLAKDTGFSRVGSWKLLKRLEEDKLIILKRVGNGKTSTYTISLNWDNILTEKNLELLLIEDAQSNQRWVDNFKEIEKNADFLIIFGSILHSPTEANDIDVLTVADKKNLKKIREIISRIQKTQVKKVHLTNLTKAEFKEEIRKQNKAFIDILKKGVVLFGQKKFIGMLREIE